MWNFIAKTLAINAIPEVVKVSVKYIESLFEDEKTRKESDRTKFTEEQIKYIKNQFESIKCHGGTQKELVDKLNKHFNTNKSLSSFKRIWNKK